MAKISFPGLKKYELMLSKLGDQSQEVAEKAVYAGAKIVADKIRSNIKKLIAYDDEAAIYAWVLKNPAPLTRTAKQGLLDGLGVSEIRNDNGYINTKVGFTGYNGIKTKSFPEGQPNVIIAQVTENGSSITGKQPFVRPAVRAKKREIEAAMAAVLDREIKKIMQ